MLQLFLTHFACCKLDCLTHVQGNKSNVNFEEELVSLFKTLFLVCEIVCISYCGCFLYDFDQAFHLC